MTVWVEGMVGRTWEVVWIWFELELTTMTVWVGPELSLCWYRCGVVWSSWIVPRALSALRTEAEKLEEQEAQDVVSIRYREVSGPEGWRVCWPEEIRNAGE